MVNFMILLKKNLLEMVRNRRIIIFSVVFVFISVISALTAKFLPELISFLFQTFEEGGSIFVEDGSVADSYVQYVANMGEVSVLLVAIMFVGAIVKEKKSGTYQILKMNGVKDKEIVLSHFVAQIILVSISYMLSVAVFVLLNILLFNQIMGVRGLVVLLYIYLTLLVTIGFSLFVSCLFKKSSRAYLVVILGYFAIGLLDIIPRINKINPFHLLTLANQLMYYEEYSLKENLTTFISSFVIIILLVIVSLVVVKNKINNRKGLNNEDNTTGI